MKKVLSLLIPVVALLGILDAGFITYEKLSGVIPPCQPGFQCETVLTSKWANIGPFPLSMLGIVFYSLVLLVSSAYFLEIREMRIAGKRFSLFRILVPLTTFGFFFSLYLVFIMAVLIKAWCVYCLLSALTCASLFSLTQLMVLVQKRESEHEYPLRLSIVALLYQYVLKPIMFCMDPEFIHNAMTSVGEVLGSTSLTKWITRVTFSFQHPKLRTLLAGIEFPNPVGLAAGFDYDAKLPTIISDVGFGFATIGTVTFGAYEGNTPPRLTRFPKSKALLVNKGFKSAGAKAIVRKLEGKDFSIPIGISIGSTNTTFSSLDDQIDDLIQCFSVFESADVRHSYYELNISCPNTKGGQPFTEKKRLERLMGAVDQLKIDRPIFVKMPIDLTWKDTAILLRVLEKSCVKGVIFGNLTKDHANPDVVETERELWKDLPGGVSGFPTTVRSNERIRLTRSTFHKRFIIIGTGGIFSASEARAKFEAGADLVQLITGMIYNGPQLIGQINWELVHEVIHN